MTENAADQMKARLRGDLRKAMKERRGQESQLIRALIAALDNAEAPPVTTSQIQSEQHRFENGTAETERLILGQAQVRDVFLAEIKMRELAAAEFERLGKADHADARRAETLIAKRYVD